MEKMPDKTLDFINRFSSNEKQVPLETIKCRQNSNFLNDKTGKKYLLYFLKNIDTELYLIFLDMLKNDRVRFIDKMKIEDSVCGTIINPGNSSVEDTRINVPHLTNGMALMALAHEIGHGLRYDRRAGNTRLTVNNDIYSETVSILFGKLFEQRYQLDFGYDDQVQAFEILNVNNAIYCNNNLKETTLNYNKALSEYNSLNNLNSKNWENIRRASNNIKRSYNNLYAMISYPVGLALLNFYQNMPKDSQEEYLRLVVSYVISNTNIGIDDILSHFNSKIDMDFYKSNFNEYIEKSNKKMRLVRGE